MEETCIYYNTCPILTGKIHLEEKKLDEYKVRFCKGEKNAWGKCIRFQVREIAGKCPLDIMPDASMSPEVIIEKFDL